MIRRQKFFSLFAICIFIAIVFAFFMAFISPRILFLGKFDAAQYMNLSFRTFSVLPELNVWSRAIIAGGVFILLAFFAGSVSQIVGSRIEKRGLSKERSKLFVDFIEEMKFANTMPDLISCIQRKLEYEANCEVAFVNRETNYVDYNCGSRFISDPETFDKLNSLLHDLLANKAYFFDNNLHIVKSTKHAKGVAIITDKSCLIIICRFLRNVEGIVFLTLINECKNFDKRSETLAGLLKLSELAQEWKMVSETQMSFLPAKIPEVKNLDIGAYYRPLVNVSGDYYDFIPVDEDKTLFVVGDVSGKGLAAALVMGVVINTVRIAPNKEDLEAVLRSVDTAIKRMSLVDKYTVLFMGLIDTKKMTIKYINASIEDPMILTPSIEGYRIKTLESTCSLIGIIDLDDIQVVEKPLYRGDVIIMSSDGIPETTNDKGIELGDTEEYREALKTYASKDAAQIVHNISSLAFSYAIGSKIRDDITIVAVKVKG